MKWSFDQKTSKLPLPIKATLIVLSVIAVSGGVSYAALTSQDKLTGSTIQTATANLSLSVDGINFASSQPGFSFDGIVPGGQPVPTDGYDLYVRNTGITALVLKLSVASSLANPDNVDLSKVHVIVAQIGGSSVQNFTLQSLVSTNTTGGVAINSPALLPSGASAVYKMRISMDSDAVDGSSASISNLDFNFNGSAVSQ